VNSKGDEVKVQRAGSAMRSMRGLLAIALTTPPALGAIFVPLFLWVQSRDRPSGSLQGLDLTSFAQRDELMMRSFAWALLIFVMAMGFLATTARNRLVIVVAGGVAAVVTFVAVFASLLAG
jgi:hypothetical protein